MPTGVPPGIQGRARAGTLATVRGDKYLAGTASNA
jgi:hypothetical protein